MTRDGKRPLAAFVVMALLLAAVSLSACGGSDPSDATMTTSSEAATTAKTPAPTKQHAQDKKKGQAGKQQRQSGGGKSSKPRHVATPLEVSGGGSAQFRAKGGDNSIQDYGEESDESELQEVAETVHAFFVARAEERWAAACSYLAKSNVEQLVKLVSQSPELKGSGCAGALKAFTRPLPASVQREITAVDAGSFRHEGEQGFLLYYGAGHTVYAMPLRNEDGTWKVASLAGSALS